MQDLALTVAIAVAAVLVVDGLKPIGKAVMDKAAILAKLNSLGAKVQRLEHENQVLRAQVAQQDLSDVGTVIDGIADGIPETGDAPAPVEAEAAPEMEPAQ